jgi:WD40 repeat protein
MEGHYGAITCLVMCKGLLYTGSADGTARCWVTEFGDCTRVFKGHNHSVICIKFDQGLGKYLGTIHFRGAECQITP